MQSTIYCTDTAIIVSTSTKFRKNFKKHVIRRQRTGKLSKYPGWQGSAASFTGGIPSFITLSVYGKYLSLNRRRLLITADLYACPLLAAITSPVKKPNLEKHIYIIMDTKSQLTFPHSHFLFAGARGGLWVIESLSVALFSNKTRISAFS